MATFTKYDVVGAKEDVSDIISNISPVDTPFLSSIGKEKIKNTIHSWQEDALASVAVNAAVEGADATDGTLVATTMRTNNTQILTKVIKVSETNDAVSKYGRATESAYQMGKASKEIKRDLEHALVGTKQTAVLGSSAVARQMAGAQAQIDVANKVKTGAAGTAMTETHFTTAMQTVWTAGGDPTTLLVTGTDSLNIAGWAAASGRTRDFSTGTKLVNAVNILVTSFGTVEVVVDRFLAAGDTIVYNPDNFKLLTLRDWTRETLAKTGDSVKMMLVGEYSLKHVNYLASGLIRREA